MILADLGAYFKRNVRRMNGEQLKKELERINEIKEIVEREMRFKGVN